MVALVKMRNSQLIVLVAAAVLVAVSSFALNCCQTKLCDKTVPNGHKMERHDCKRNGFSFFFFRIGEFRDGVRANLLNCHELFTNSFSVYTFCCCNIFSHPDNSE